MKTPREHFTKAINDLLAEKDMDKHAMQVGYANGFADALGLSGAITEEQHAAWLGELLAAIESSLVILNAQHH